MSTQKPSKNDIAWEHLFAERDILNDVMRNGIHNISASVINQKREARLMTKFDHEITLPAIFRRNKLAILSTSRNSYAIGQFACYERLPKMSNDDILEASLPKEIESIVTENLYSEPAALLCAQHAGIISHILEEENVALTVLGRMSTGQFSFFISNVSGDNGSLKTHNLKIDRAQCEIDGGFEGRSLFAVIEAKNVAVDDFNVRQLYFPYRLWVSKLSKTIVPIFFTYSNEVFSFYVYRFTQLENYNSIELVKRKHYQIVPTDIEVNDIRKILYEVKIENPPAGEPFPQADRFDKIVDLLLRLRGTGIGLTQHEVTTYFAFDVRQTQYYTAAGRYLGLIERVYKHESGVSYVLSDSGFHLMGKAASIRNLTLARLVLSRPVFRYAMRFYLDNGYVPSKPMVVSYMKDAGVRIEKSTLDRRVQTVVGWIRWIVNLTKED